MNAKTLSAIGSFCLSSVLFAGTSHAAFEPVLCGDGIQSFVIESEGRSVNFSAQSDDFFFEGIADADANNFFLESGDIPSIRVSKNNAFAFVDIGNGPKSMVTASCAVDEQPNATFFRIFGNTFGSGTWTIILNFSE